MERMQERRMKEGESEGGRIREKTEERKRGKKKITHRRGKWERGGRKHEETRQ